MIKTTTERLHTGCS